VSVPLSSFETALAAVGEQRLIFDTRRVMGSRAASLLDRRPVLMRSIGAVYSFSFPDDFFERAILPLDYDGIIWFATSTPTRLRP
jgi:erythromycin esterase-like protein